MELCYLKVKNDALVFVAFEKIQQRKKSVLENWIIIWGRKLAVCPVMRTQILIHSFIIDQAPLYVRH